MNPINAIGAVSIHSDNNDAFLGTAFCFKSPRFLLTAAHIIPEHMGLISVVFPYANKILIPTKIALHGTADIAVLACEMKHVNNQNTEGVEHFSSIGDELSLAGDYLTYGYPEDISFVSGPRPTPRVFKGYFQRFFVHSSHMGFNYSALELSTACPKGLSGAPLMVYGNASCLAGIVTENIEASTELHVEESEGNERYVYRKVVNFGVAAKLSELKDWIEEHYAEIDS